MMDWSLPPPAIIQAAPEGYARRNGLLVPIDRKAILKEIKRRKALEVPGVIFVSAAAAAAAPVTFISSAGVTVAATTTHTFTTQTLHATLPVFVTIHWRGIATLTSFSLNAVAGTIVAQVSNSAAGVAIGYATPGAATGSVVITLSAATGTNFAYTSYYGAPASTTPVDSVTGTATSTTALVLTDLSVAAGGFSVIGLTGQNAANRNTYAWNGTDTITERVDSSTNTNAINYSSAEIANAETNTTRDATITPDSSNSRAGVGASWGAP